MPITLSFPSIQPTLQPVIEYAFATPFTTTVFSKFLSIVAGEVFGKDGFLRCSYALSDNDLKEGLTRLKDALESI